MASGGSHLINRPHLTFSSGAELSHCEQGGNQSLFTSQLSSAPRQRGRHSHAGLGVLGGAQRRLTATSRQGRGCVVIPGNVIFILSHKSACQEPKQPARATGGARPAARPRPRPPQRPCTSESDAVTAVPRGSRQPIHTVLGQGWVGAQEAALRLRALCPGSKCRNSVLPVTSSATHTRPEEPQHGPDQCSPFSLEEFRQDRTLRCVPGQGSLQDEDTGSKQVFNSGLRDEHKNMHL